MLLDFMEDPYEWLKEYHTRSNAETGVFTFERDFLPPTQEVHRAEKEDGSLRQSEKLQPKKSLLYAALRGADGVLDGRLTFLSQAHRYVLKNYLRLKEEWE